MNLKKILAVTAIWGAIGLGLVTMGKSCSRNIPEAEIRQMKLKEQYRRERNYAYERLSRDADLNWDGKMNKEEYNHALKLGGYIGRELKVADLTSGELSEHHPLEIINKAITQLEAERFKDLDN